MATRIYLPSSGAAPVTPSTWNFPNQINQLTFAGLLAKINSTMTTKLEATGTTSPIFRAMFRWVIGPLAAVQISGTVNLCMRGMESNAGANASLAIAIKIIQSGGADRSVLLAYTAADLMNDTNYEFGTSLASMRAYNATEVRPIPLTPQTPTAGDYLVIEVGFRSATTVSRNISLRYGDTTTADLADGQAETNDYAPWVDFSQNLTWLQTKTTNLNAYLQKIYTPGTSLDAYLKKLTEKTSSLDACLLKGLLQTLGADGLLQKLGLTRTASVDAFLQSLGLTSTASMDAILYAATTYLLSVSIDALVQKDQSRTASLDSNLQKGLTKSLDVDGLVQKGLTKTLDADGILQKLGLTKSLDADGILQKLGLTKTLDADGILQKLDMTKSTSADAVLQILAQLKTVSLDSYLYGILFKTIGADGILQKLGLSQTASADALLQKLGLTGTVSLDAILYEIGANILTLSIDALLQKSRAEASSLDALIVMIGFKSFGIDGVLQRVMMEGTSLDAVLIPGEGQGIKTLFLDALIASLNRPVSSSLDAWLIGIQPKRIDVGLEMTGSGTAFGMLGGSAEFTIKGGSTRIEISED